MLWLLMLLMLLTDGTSSLNFQAGVPDVNGADLEVSI